MEAAGREDEQQRKDQSDAHASFYGDSGHTGTRRSAPRYDRCAITRGERLSLTRGTEAFPHSRHGAARSEEHTSELQSLMRISYAVFCLKKKTKKTATTH